ncbi:MAG: DUF1232 domain-containing protein [Candidatus Riflebacteria bacterium]|nr:DUF1232 domain-containing protein [Candidatus Riflebacteria bacterium]
MAKSSLQIKVEETLLKYINRFVRYARFAHLTKDRRELLIGTFLYLLDEGDLIPDDVPNIGYMDDLTVFVNIAAAFVKDGQAIPGVCNPEEVKEDLGFLEKNKGLMYGQQVFSVDVIRKKGKSAVDLGELVDQIKIKYSQLGKVDA